MNQEELVKYAESKGIMYKLIDGKVRVMDLTQLPGELRASFNGNGDFIGDDIPTVETEAVTIEPGVTVEVPVVETEGVTFDPASAANERDAPVPDKDIPLEESDSEGEDLDKPVTLRGPLPDGFPGKTALEEAGHGTYAKARKLVSKGEGWWKDVTGIGEVTAGHIEEAMKESE